MSRALWHEGGGSALIACTFFTQRRLVEPPSSSSRRVFSRAWQRRASRWRCCRRVRPWSVVSCFRARDCLAQPHSLLAGAAGLPSLKALLASEWDDSGAFACGWIRLGVGRHRRFRARDGVRISARTSSRRAWFATQASWVRDEAACWSCRPAELTCRATRASCCWVDGRPHRSGWRLGLWLRRRLLLRGGGLELSMQS